ncbi:MAG: chromosome segregation protein SMC, partial [Alphaproteobacteria bacterium]
MKITRLRLLGFKSFVEPTELLIEPGLTGVVGPNGCGKSNLLEALRWVMGETSFKTMRASSMDDVIFAGTQNRPARNMAEVSIFIDNSERSAPAEFNDSDQLEVSRRIERDAGSAYKINGKDVRARDVRLLFEDAATGARSPALVRQGRIGEIVNAKPQDRRRILEDAAGIAGLHSRRHEAELRLKATEGNLERLQDLMGQMTSQLNSLKRQARQARRYKEVSHEIRRMEALQHHIHWASACTLVEKTEGELQEAVRALGQATQAEAEAQRAHNEAADALQPLRDEEAVRAAVLHRLSIERDTLDQEEERMRSRLEELEQRREQLRRDIERERENVSESEEALARLQEEEAALKTSAGDAEAEEAARAAAEEKATELAGAEEQLGSLNAQLAEARAERNRLEADVLRLSTRIAQLEQQQRESSGQLEALKAERGEDGEIAALEEKVATCAARLAQAEEQAAEAKAAHAQARAKENEIREAATAARLRAQELETEVQTLTKLLEPDETATWLPIVQDVRAEPGYELALGAALGDDLDASADPAAPAHWERLEKADDPALPEGATPLARFVEGPDVLSRRLAQIGVVDAAEGARLQSALKPGQRLVSVQGDLWRWDGYMAMAEAPTAAAKRLKERNRLDALKREAEEARAKAVSLGEALESARAAVGDAEQAERQSDEARRAAQGSLDEARTALKSAEDAARQSTEAFGALSEALKRVNAELEEVRTAYAEARAALDALASSDSLVQEVEARREEVAARRAAYME